MTAIINRSASRRFRALATLAAGGAMAASSPAATWIEPAGGSWQTPEHWSPTGIPSAGDTATFNLTSAYTVSLADPTAISGIAHTAGTVTLDLGTKTLSDAGMLTVSGSTTASPPTLTVLNGTLNPNGVFVGQTGGTGTIVIGAGATVTDTSGNAVTVGSNSAASNGTLSITSGAHVTSSIGGLYVGYFGGTGQATIDGNGSSFTLGNSGRLLVGDQVYGAATTGTLTVSGGATLMTPVLTDAVIGAEGGKGTLNVQAGSLWRHGGNAYVGGNSLTSASAAGTGTLNVAGGGIVTLDGDLVVRPGGTLRIAGGTVNVAKTATLSGTTQMRLISVTPDGTNNDTKLIAATDELNTTIAVSLAPGVTPSAGSRFDLFDGMITGTYAFDFSQAPLASGLAWDTSSFAFDGSVGVTATPEPGVVVLGGLVAQALLIGRPRRRGRQAR